ncbi:MAG TPA: hypothetical protein VFF78_01850, partial [Anaerolineaceae bacterium]|nr:hypothetical protein [Anaerolineaceae bacterium]
ELYQQQGKFEDAAGQYDQFLTLFPDDPRVAEVQEKLPDVYLGWAENLIIEKKFEECEEKLNMILADFATSTAATQVPTVMVSLQAAWGQELAQKSDFIQAIEKLTAAKAGLTDAQLLKIVEEALNSAIQGLAKDDGEQGSQVLEEAILQACAYQTVTSPAIGILTDSVHAVMCAKNLTLEDKYIPTRPGDFYYAVFVKEGYNEIERCPYGRTGAFTLIRQQVYWEVTIRNVVTGQVYQQKTFTGGTPNACPPQWYFDSLPDYLLGSYPDGNAVIKWVQGFLKP